MAASPPGTSPALSWRVVRAPVGRPRAVPPAPSPAVPPTAGPLTGTNTEARPSAGRASARSRHRRAGHRRSCSPDGSAGRTPRVSLWYWRHSPVKTAASSASRTGATSSAAGTPFTPAGSRWTCIASPSITAVRRTAAGHGPRSASSSPSAPPEPAAHTRGNLKQRPSDAPFGPMILRRALDPHGRRSGAFARLRRVPSCRPSHRCTTTHPNVLEQDVAGERVGRGLDGGLLCNGFHDPSQTVGAAGPVGDACPVGRSWTTRSRWYRGVPDRPQSRRDERGWAVSSALSTVDGQGRFRC